MNLNIPQGAIRLNLRGIAIGDGWIHPVTQNAAYVSYPYTLGLIDAKTRDRAAILYARLKAAIDAGEWDSANNLSNYLESMVVTAAGIDQDNVMDSSDPMNDVLNLMPNYLNSAAMRSLLNVGNNTWTFVSNSAGNALNADEQQSVLHLFPNLIASYKVMLYVGNMDLNCNVEGIQNFLPEMGWSGYNKFYEATTNQWWIDNKSVLAGYVKASGNFVFTVVRNSGHEVPYFQPASAQDMIYRWIAGEAPFKG